MLEAGVHKRWRTRGGEHAAAIDPQAADLAHALGVPLLVARLLVVRGMTSPETAQPFLTPKISDLHDPALLPGVPRAAERIAEAVRARQPIVIYGDYDVDGITAAAILWHTLTLAGADVSTYVPHRLEEGYGLNCDAIAELARRDDGQLPLIISVDCGITAVAPAQTARDLGVDLIITDHHTFDLDALPPAHTLVHPKLPVASANSKFEIRNSKSPYPYPELCGAGVAFKLAWQVSKTLCGSERVPGAFRDLLMDLLSLVALGTVADVVPLRDENRVLTIFGLQRIKQTRFVGINAMIDAARLRDEKIDAYHVGFVLGPRLNACGRMGHAREAVHLLTAATADEARDLASFLTAENERRRTTERAIFEEAQQAVLDAGYHADDQRAIVVGKPDWHPGVIGIVASRLVEKFGRPVVMLNFENDVAKGSARSVEGISIHEAFGACAEHLDTFGGHAMAAGVRLHTDNVKSFREALVRFVNERLKPEELVGLIEVDGELTLRDCTVDLFEQVQRLAPFGRGNPMPRLLLRRVTLEAPAKQIGQKGNHLSLMLRQGEQRIRAVAFGMGELAHRLPAGVVVDLVFEPHVSTWQGQRRAEVQVKDLKIGVGG